MTDEELDKLIEDAVGHEADFWGRTRLRRLCHLAIEAEREACAQVAEDAEYRKWDTIRTGGKLEGFGAADIAAAIRKRGETGH